MFRNPFTPAPLVQDITDVLLRLRVTRADAAIMAASEYRLPTLRVQ